MPGQRTPASARLGGSITRRHAALLQSGMDSGGVCVKDLRIHRVVPPASASASVSLDSLSPECAAPAKPVPVEWTPLEAVSAAVVEDLERKPVPPRSKLVRDTGSFGYRRLLPFLNQMAENDCTTMPSEYKDANSPKELNRSRIWLVDESAGGGYRESDPLDSPEPMAAKTAGGPEMKNGCDIVGEETNSVPRVLAGSKPWLTRCSRSKKIHHQSSFSYKRMLPFLRENEISSQEGERTKFRRVAEERQLTPDEYDLSASGKHDLAASEISSQEGEHVKFCSVAEERQLTPDKSDLLASGKHHLAALEDTSIECQSAQIENMDEDKPSNADGSHVPGNRQLQPAVPNASSPERSAAEVHSVIQEETCTLNQDPLASFEDDSTTDGIDVLAGGQYQLPVSGDSIEECISDVAETKAQDRALKSDGSYVLEPAISEASSLENSTSEGGKATEEQPVTSDGEERNTLTSDSGEFLTKEKPQLCDTKELLTAQETSEFPQVPQFQSSDLGCPDVGFGSPTISEASSLENSTSEGGKATEEQPVTSDGEERNTLTSDSGEFLTKEKPQLCDTKELLTAQETSEFPQAPQFQSSDLGCPEVGFGSPTKTLIPLLSRFSLEHREAMGDPHLDAVMISRHSDPCAVDRFLSLEEMSGSVSRTESRSSKVGILQPSEARSLGKRGPSPKKLSPRKGILKRHTRGCKGICMCLDCSTYRLRADRAFEFSRKQMQEADDIIVNLLKEMSNLRSLVEKPAGQRESIQAACQRASQVEEVARDRCQQMFVDLNSQCRIPGPRVRFVQYVEEKLGLSPRSSKHVE